MAAPPPLPGTPCGVRRILRPADACVSSGRRRRPDVSQRLGLLLSVIALIFASGSQWMVLQGIAWARMIVVYSQETSFLDAVSQTFSGRRPCALCHLARQGQNEQSKQTPLLRLSDPLELIPTAPGPRILALDRRIHLPRRRESPAPESPSFSPPKPPPRCG